MALVCYALYWVICSDFIIGYMERNAPRGRGANVHQDFLGGFILFYRYIIVGFFFYLIATLVWSVLSFTAGFAEMLPVNLIVGFGISLLLIYVVDRILVVGFRFKPIIQCDRCETPLGLLPENILNQELFDTQKSAQKLGSKQFEGWHCPHCYPDNLSKFHLREYMLNNSRFSECPYCQELTVVRKEEIIKQPSYSDTGIRQITYRCQCCDYLQEKQEIIPRLVRTYTSSNSNDDSGSGGGFGGGGFGGGGFGGGDSGGGGAGGDF